MNLFSNSNPDSENGHRSDDALNTLNNHHPDTDSIDDDVQHQEPHPETIKVLRRSFIFLVIIGLVLGTIVATGVIYLMNRFDLTGQPSQTPIEQVE
ncbi:hypothetical protein M595_3581 [Lyngbya aestuarii BL J]|uniref:Uncharacterized protein n=1 Tax=Lyngbya aestuarii BL J TaxID=1348334 RepID=U7QGS3_9CYAN|nr:hypothetical protein [Lyngbya aestuarii]ERT06452.1 hypothetical protein M595_3581 [Lyngbya aestuarii BL J]